MCTYKCVFKHITSPYCRTIHGSGTILCMFLPDPLLYEVCLYIFFPYVCDSSLALTPSMSGSGEIDDGEGCRNGETVATVM